MGKHELKTKANKGLADALIVPDLENKLAEFCRRWQIVEFALFGSAVRDDFGPDSDVDVLVTFTPDAPWSVLELVEMLEELKGIFGRDVDLIEEEALTNPFRRRAILREKKVIYAAQG